MFNSDYGISDTTPSDDVITLKVSKRPVKFYKFLKYEKEKLYDFKHFLSKIQSISKKSFNHIIYLKKRTEELQIATESDWNDYFFNNTIEEFIDSRNILKVEFELTKQQLNESDPNEKTLRIFSHYNSEVFMNKLLGFLSKNESVQNEFYEYLLKDIQTNIGNKSSIDGIPIRKSAMAHQSPQIREILKRQFSDIQHKVILLKNLESNVASDDFNSTDEVKEESNEEVFQPFASYYTADKQSTFRSRIINECMPIQPTLCHFSLDSPNNQ